MAVERTRDIVIDQMFHVPVGVVDVRQEEKTDGQYSYTDATRAAQGPLLLTPNSTVPMPPTSFSIADQAVRTTPDGRTVVDVTIEFQSVTGVSNIDVRVTALS